MATATSRSVVDKPRGPAMAKWPEGLEQALASTLQALKLGRKRVRARLLESESADVRADYAEAMRLLGDLINQVKSAEDKSAIPVDRIRRIASTLEAIRPEQPGTHEDALSGLRREIDECFGACQLIPTDFKALHRQIDVVEDLVSMRREVSVVVKTCSEATSQSVTYPQTLREGDEIQFLLQRLTLLTSAAPNIGCQLFLQERRRHRWTKSGIQWRLLQIYEKFGDLPATSETPVEVFVFDRTEDYVVAVVGQDLHARGPPRDDFAIAIGTTDDVHSKIVAHLPNVTFKYKWGPEEQAVWIGTPETAGMQRFTCDLHVITA